MTMRQVTRGLHGLYLMVLVAAVGMLAVAMTGCGGEDAVSAEEAADRAMVASFLDEFEPDAEPLVIDADERYNRPQQQDGEVEKGSYAALTGWGLSQCLAFQDGVPERFGRDHCEYYGRSCDSNWHSQACVTGFDTEEQFRDQWVGRCNQENAWGPCMLPYLTRADRTVSWHFNALTCPNSAVGRDAIRTGAISAMTYLREFALIDTVQVDNPEQADMLIVCDPNLPSDSGGRWTPFGDITLQYALADADQSLTISEGCETGGWPGSNSGRNYLQSLDMTYTYQASQLALNYTAVFNKLATCAVNANDLTRAMRLLILHEAGHYLGLAHHRHHSGSNSVMYGDSFACEEMVLYTQSYTSLEVAAIYETDVSTDSDGLDVYDVDLSCLTPEGQ